MGTEGENMRKVIVMIVAFVGLALPLKAQETVKSAETKPAESLPTIDQILEKYVRALGNKAAAEKLKTVYMKGSLEVSSAGLNGTTEVFNKAPNKQAVFSDLSGYGTFRSAFNGTEGWTEFPNDGIRSASGIQLAEMRRNAILLREYKLKEIYPKMKLLGKEKSGDREAYVLEATPAEGSVEKLYFETQTGLLIRVDGETDTPEGRLPSERYLEDYKEVDGIQYPMTMRQSTPSYELIIKISEVKHDVPVDDSKFEKPVPK
jgi:zinc protease